MSDMHADADTEHERQIAILARQQFNELTEAVTADDAIRILAWERTPTGVPFNDADAYFLGETGTCLVWGGLRTAGWRTIWSGGRDHYVMQAPDGTAITYIENSVYWGDRRP